MFIRIRWEQRGGHIHCRVFIGQSRNMTLQKTGDLVFDEKEWPVTLDRLKGFADEVKREDED